MINESWHELGGLLQETWERVVAVSTQTHQHFPKKRKNERKAPNDVKTHAEFNIEEETTTSIHRSMPRNLVIGNLIMLKCLACYSVCA